VRELRNVIQRAVLLCGEGPIISEHLPPIETDETVTSDTEIRPISLLEPVDSSKTARFPAALPDEKRRELETIEQKRIQAALEECAGNQTRAAKLLGISRRSLVMKLTKYGMPRPRKKAGEAEPH
jgi:DNA-binding NtrC family response regulator